MASSLSYRAPAHSDNLDLDHGETAMGAELNQQDAELILPSNDESFNNGTFVASTQQQTDASFHLQVEVTQLELSLQDLSLLRTGE